MHIRIFFPVKSYFFLKEIQQTELIIETMICKIQ